MAVGKSSWAYWLHDLVFHICKMELEQYPLSEPAPQFAGLRAR